MENSQNSKRKRSRPVLLANIRDLPYQIIRFQKLGRHEDVKRCERILIESRAQLDRMSA